MTGPSDISEGSMSKSFNLGPLDTLVLKLSRRIGQMEAWGLPWQRKDREMLGEARDMLAAVSRHVRLTGTSVTSKDDIARAYADREKPIPFEGMQR